MKKELISIIVPIYNVEKYLSKCIDSIINQTYKNLEILLVNDGSPDNSGKICTEYAKKDKRIRIINKENGGLSDARNFGLDNSKGDYICFIDSDDYIENNMIEELYKNLINNNSDISVCDYVIFDEYHQEYNNYSNNIFIVENNKYDLLFNEYRLVTTVQWNKLFRRKIFSNLRFEKGKVNEDEFILCYELEKANKISFLLKPYYHYYQRTNSIMNTFNIKRFDAIEAFNRQIEFFKKRNMAKEMIKSMIVKFSSGNILLLKARNSDVDKKILLKYEKDNKKLGIELLKKYRKEINLKNRIKILIYIVFPNLYYKLIEKYI